MHTAFFGQYLLSQGLIDANQLSKALTAQETLNKNFGTLAVNQKLLYPEQVKKILELQKTEDLFFGECAQKLGYLNQEQVDKLVKIQTEEHVCLGEILVTLGYISKLARDEALANFIKEQNKRGKTLPPYSHLEILKKEKPFIEKFTANTVKLLHRMSGIIIKFEKYETIAQILPLPAFAVKVDHVDKTGKCVLRYILLLEKEIAHIMHIKVCRQNNIDPLIIPNSESLNELLNIICCASAANCRSITPSAPQVLTGNKFDFEQNTKPILVSLISPYGKISFVLSFLWED
ncbi:MAG: hypothetical protein KKD05_08210 [Candidatus Omnitrophica bacterium]|nr:hypothetical protein [Candidatus Omnitrophota bacterium]